MLLAGLVTVMFGGFAGGSVANAELTTDPDLAADYAARWLIDQAQGNGGYTNTSITADVALGYDAAESADNAQFAAMEYLLDNSASIGSSGDPALIGKTILAAVFYGQDPPTNFRGTDLIAALLATKQTSGVDTGLFGNSDPNIDAVARQGLALLGLDAAGVVPPADAVSWLTAQQCASGGFPAYRADTVTPCPDPEFALVGEDTNSTSYAYQALVALGVSPTANVLDWLATLQNADGGFGIYTNDPTDAISSSLVAMAVVAGGEDPTAGRWVSSGGLSALDAITALQVGCEGAADRIGAIQYNSVAGVVDVSTTAKAMIGLTGKAFPFTGQVGLAIDIPPCPAPSTTTTAPGGGGGGGGGGGATTTAVAAGQLPATGAPGAGGLSVAELGLLGFGLLAAGVALVGQHRSRVRST